MSYDVYDDMNYGMSAYDFVEEFHCICDLLFEEEYEGNEMPLVEFCLQKRWPHLLYDLFTFYELLFPNDYSCHLLILSPSWVNLTNTVLSERITEELLNYNFSFAHRSYIVSQHDSYNRMLLLHNAGVSLSISDFPTHLKYLDNIINEIRKPRTLLHQCKIIIRSSFGPCSRQTLERRINLLCLPPIIKNYIFEKFQKSLSIA